MKKTVIVIGVCFLSILSFFSGCVNVPDDLTRFSIVSFDVEPAIINQGEYANLSWIVISADTVTIDNGIGNVALTGHRMIQPMQTTTYILTASNSTTTKNVTATITVNSEPQTPSQQTPNIRCTINDATNRIIISSVDANVRWSDIEITTNNINATWQVQDINNNGLARIGDTSTISGYVNVGDSILLLETNGNVTVTLAYEPTSYILGSWIVNV